MPRVIPGVVVFLALACAAGHSATLRVPEDYPSVLAAVDAAMSGDSVLVGPGTWTATATRVVNVNGQLLPITACAFLKPGITVIGRNGPAATSLQPAAGDGLVHVGAGTSGTLVQGFTVTADEGVIVSHAAPLELRNCWLLDNAVVAVTAASAQVVLRACKVVGNSWSSGGYSVNSQSSQLEFYDCEIRDNPGSHGVRIFGSPQVIMDGCVVSGHKNFGACKFEDVLDLQVRNSVFVDNKDVGGGAGVDATDSFGVVEFCVFARDSASGGNQGSGGGFQMTRGSVRVENNTFYACYASGLGSAISISGDDPGVRNNIIAYSAGPWGAVARSQGSNDASTGCNILWANETADFAPLSTWTPSPTDIFADPQFCAPTSDDFTLHSSSPGAPGVTPACGTIGALGVGCGSVSIESTSWGRIKGQYR